MQAPLPQISDRFYYLRKFLLAMATAGVLVSIDSSQVQQQGIYPTRSESTPIGKRAKSIIPERSSSPENWVEAPYFRTALI